MLAYLLFICIVYSDPPGKKSSTLHLDTHAQKMEETLDYDYMCDEELSPLLTSSNARLQEMMSKYHELSREKFEIRKEMEKELTNLQSRKKKIALLTRQLWQVM